MLNSTQPFDASFSQIYFESSTTAVRLQTRAAQALATYVHDPDVRLVVLTGDAGHGKTFMCAELLMAAFGLDIESARNNLRERGFGDEHMGVLADDRQLYVIKDLSELPTTTTPDLLAKALAATDRVTVVCANEGRLRAAISDDPNLGNLLDLLDSSIHVGSTTTAGVAAAILNLNHQSVVAAEEDTTSLLDQVLAEWVLGDEPWRDCSTCSLSADCPVYRNRSDLAEPGEAGASTRTVLAELLRVVERTGHIITIRELLILVSHLITGGLRCKDVEAACLEAEPGWQWEHLFHQVCFGALVPPEVAEGLGAFRGLRNLDPGRRALRSVDDRLDIPMECGPFDPPIPNALTRAPTTSAQATEQSQAHAALWRGLRRRDIFRAHTSSSPAMTYERLGLRHASAFDAIVAGKVTSDVRHSLIAGLAAVQGLSSTSPIALKLVDPAFTTGSAVQRTARGSGAGAVVIAGSLTADKIVIASQSEAWHHRNGGSRPGVVEKIDWSERHVVLSFDSATFEEHRSIMLDLAALEFLISFGKGLRAWHFYEPEVRRVLRRLAVVTDEHVSGTDIIELTSSQGDFKVLVDGTSLMGGA